MNWLQKMLGIHSADEIARRIVQIINLRTLQDKQEKTQTKLEQLARDLSSVRLHQSAIVANMPSGTERKPKRKNEPRSKNKAYDANLKGVITIIRQCRSNGYKVWRITNHLNELGYTNQNGNPFNHYNINQLIKIYNL